MNEYIKALNSGKELVIVAEDSGFYSSVFWKTDGKYYCFNRSQGIVCCNYMDDNAMMEHITLMIDEDAIIFIRG